MDLSPLTRKKQALDRYRPLPDALVRNLEAWFTVELTYTSNAIEGNTLTRRETAVVIEKGLTVGGRSLKEHLEAANHAEALAQLYAWLAAPKKTISEAEVLTLHRLILKGVEEAHAGHCRRVPVRISGAAVVMPNPHKVPDLMAAFFDWLASASTMHPVTLAMEAHYRLVSIHPFVDGNGRTARLLMNLLLMQRGYPPAIIRPRDRLAYLAALEQAQLGGTKAPYERLMARAVSRSLDIYLNAAKGKSTLAAEAGVLKIGALAEAAGETIATIRFWTKEGLLEVAETTASGYQLYSREMIARCARIRALKRERYPLAEIRERL